MVLSANQELTTIDLLFEIAPLLTEYTQRAAT
jgi:hypothetical protein